MKTWKIIAVVVVGILILSMAACTGGSTGGSSAPAATPPGSSASSSSGGSASAEPALTGSITFGTNRTDLADNLLQDKANEFMAAHPGTTITFEGIGNPEQDLATRMASEELPDITIVLKNITPDKYADYFLPIDDLGFSPDTLLFYNKGVGTDGKLYTTTETMSYFGICYNKSAFKAAGIDKIPTTKAEFFDVCQKLKAAGITPLATAFKDKWTLMYYSDEFEVPSSLVGDANYRSNLKNQDAILTDDGGTLASFQFMRDMADKGYLESDLFSANWDQLKKDFGSGKAAMFYAGTWFPPHMVNDNGSTWDDQGMFPFPDAKGTPLLSDWSHAIAKNTKSPELAKAFYKYCFIDGKFAEWQKFIPAIKGVPYDNPTVDEILSYNLPILEFPAPLDETVTNIFNQSQIDLEGALQEYMTSKDPQSVVTKVNDQWAKTKAEVVK